MDSSSSFIVQTLCTSSRCRSLAWATEGFQNLWAVVLMRLTRSPPPEEKVWTVLAHNGTAAVAVQGSSLQRPHVTRFDYGASAEQLRAVVTGSEHCQQEVVYNCKKSRLFNTKGQCYFSSCRRRAAQLTAIVLCFWYQAVT